MMAQKKKRQNVAVNEKETSKKRKIIDNVDEDIPIKPKSHRRKETSGKEQENFKDEDVHPEESAGKSDTWDYPINQGDIMELFLRMESNIPPNDAMVFSTRAERLDWDEISFANYTASQCKETWTEIQKKLRRFRLLKELITDARQWLSKPWTNFYHGAKQNQHPEMPRRPLSQYMIYYMEKKDKVLKQNPNLDMTNVSKLIAEMYKGLPSHKKEIYNKKAADLREQYQEKLKEFYANHPEMLEEKVKGNTKETIAKMREGYPGSQKPRTPMRIFLDEKLRQCGENPSIDKVQFMEAAKQQWKTLSDKKRLFFINWACEEESKYLDGWKLYQSENPNFKPPAYKSVLKKDEVQLKERAAGKPNKPPYSAYSLYSRIMLANSPELKKLLPKERMVEISRRWKEMPESAKLDYQKQVKYELDQYKLEYASYLESLPEDQRQEELLKNQSLRKRKTEFNSKDGNKESRTSQSQKSRSKKAALPNVLPEKVYFPGEPPRPPVNAYELFKRSFATDTTLSLEEAPRYWERLPAADKAKFQKKLKELKDKYVKDYGKFLKSLDEDQLAEYNDLQVKNQARNSEQTTESASENESSSSDEDEEDDEDNEEEEKGKTEAASKPNDDDSDSDDDSSSSSSGSSSSSSEDSDSSSEDSDDVKTEKNAQSSNAAVDSSGSDSSDNE